jgi:TPR repeat protein
VMAETGMAQVAGLPDYAEALKWYRLAASQGYAPGGNNLGLLYAKGQGVELDYVRAYLWFNLAAASGHADAIRHQNIMQQQMNPQELAAAKALTQECWQRNFKACD